MYAAVLCHHHLILSARTLHTPKSAQAGPQYNMYFFVKVSCCSKNAEAEAGVSVNEKKWLVMHVHVQMRLDELTQSKLEGKPPQICQAGSAFGNTNVCKKEKLECYSES